MAGDAQSSFKVIIAGGSVVGLMMALILEKAGIDFVLLEKREIAPRSGASISMHSHCQIMLEQLGVWDDVADFTVPLKKRSHFDDKGNLFDDSLVLEEISRMTNNRATTFMPRYFFLQTVYDHIQDKSKVRDNTGVAAYTETADGVEVTTEDGEVIKGDLLIGGDGIHSTIRRLMATKIAAEDPEASQELLTGFQSAYHAIFATSRNSNSQAGGKPFLPDAHVHNVYYPGYSGITAVGVSGLVFWFLFIKSDETTRYPNCPRYTEKDIKSELAKYGDSKLGPGYNFNDLWADKIDGNMIALEEGVIKSRWSHGGRVVLMGDTVHKCTINAGLGGNLAIEGIAHLVNGLIPLVRRCEADGAGSRKPSWEELAAVMDEYETKQRPRANKIVSLSGYVTRFEAMDNWWLRTLKRVVPWVSDTTKANTLVSYMNDAPHLDFLPHPDRA